MLLHYNTVFVAGRPVAFIDRDFAAPGPRVWDLVHAAYRLVPLTRDEHAAVARRDPLAGECVAAGQQLLVVSGQAAGAAFATQQPEAAEMGSGWSSPAVLVWPADGHRAWAKAGYGGPSGWELTAAMLDASDVLVVLGQLDRAGVVVWLDGGWGVDALVGRQSRPHHDLDLVIARDDCPAAQAALAGLGFQPELTAVPGWPARLVLVDASGRRVDLHPVVFDQQGHGWQELGQGAWGAYPAEGLTGVGRVRGRQVRCLTPQLQVRHHLGYPMGATDRHDLGLLAERFGVAVPPGIPTSAGDHRPEHLSDTP